MRRCASRSWDQSVVDEVESGKFGAFFVAPGGRESEFFQIKMRGLIWSMRLLIRQLECLQRVFAQGVDDPFVRAGQ